MSQHATKPETDSSPETAQVVQGRTDETAYEWAPILGLEEAYESKEGRGERHPFAKPYRRGRIYRGVGLG